MYSSMIVAVEPSRSCPDRNPDAFPLADLANSGTLLLLHVASLTASTTCGSLDVNSRYSQQSHNHLPGILIVLVSPLTQLGISFCRFTEAPRAQVIRTLIKAMESFIVTRGW